MNIYSIMGVGYFLFGGALKCCQQSRIPRSPRGEGRVCVWCNARTNDANGVGGLSGSRIVTSNPAGIGTRGRRRAAGEWW